ncbi:MAG: Jag N-terminal domain-containing protein [Deltaproteobacteria bacterium]|nr:Jag N-terminal domain-containing protein [Deltaproteobacteria bacterium]
MSSFLEFEGKTLEKAVKKACDELNISKKQLEHEVISYGSTGIFGLVGAKKARIRVRVPEPTPEAVPEPLNREQRQNNAAFEQTAGEVDSTEIERSGELELHTFPDDPIVLGRSILQRIVDFITTDAKIKVTEGPDRIMFDVKGGNSAILIGKRGQTLEAIQYLVEKMVNKQNEKRVRIQIDVEGYLENRRLNLEKLAGRLADKAKRTGKPATIGQINAHDRRIVHIALKDDNGVRTQSMGDGLLKKLVIIPKKNSQRKRWPGRDNSVNK